MRLRPTPRVHAVKEEKEARLKAFVARHLESLREAGVSGEGIAYSLLAVSAESPVARALASLAPELAAAGVKVEAVLVQRAEAGAGTQLDGADCRFATDIRLLDAHEQLVLDATTAWIGDCMRRDPSKRDAYELFCDRCPTTAAHAARSFARLWNAAGPTGSLTAEREWSGPQRPSLFDPSLIAGADPTSTPATLRH